MDDNDQIVETPVETPVETADTEDYQYSPSEEMAPDDADLTETELSEADEYMPATDKSASKAKLKKILLPIGLVLVILFVYQILSWYSKSKQTERAQQPVTPQATMQTKVAPITKKSVITPIATTPVVSTKTTEHLQALQSNLTKSDQKLNALISEATQNKQNIASLNQSIEGLSVSLNELNKNFNAYLMKIKKAEMAKRKAVLRKKTIYHIKAIVPGRAWLVSSRGQTMSVRVGDKVNNGVVQLISPAKGLVLTSTGEMIQYGSNDI